MGEEQHSLFESRYFIFNEIKMAGAYNSLFDAALDAHKNLLALWKDQMCQAHLTWSREM